jgi:hypothetical protein
MLKKRLSSGNHFFPFQTREGNNHKLETRPKSPVQRSKSRRKLITLENSNLGPNAKIKKYQELDDFRPGRKQVASKREEQTEMLKWKVDEVRLRDNRPLSLKFSKSRKISPKITQKKVYNMDKVTARMEQIKRELRENMNQDVSELKSRKEYNTFNQNHYNPSKPETNFYSRKLSHATERLSSNKFHSNQPSFQNESSGAFQNDVRNGRASPSPNSRSRINSRKEFLKQTYTNGVHATSNRHNQSYNSNTYCKYSSYYSPFAQEFHSRNERSVSPNNRRNAFDRSSDVQNKTQIVLTPKRKKLLDEFQSSQMN